MHDPSTPLEALDGLTQQNGQWCFTVLSYDLKDHIEKIDSDRMDAHVMPVVLTVVPQRVFRFDINSTAPGFLILQGDFNGLASACYSLIQLVREAYHAPAPSPLREDHSSLQPTLPRDQYHLALQAIKKHLQRGDIYEVNYCHEFVGHGELKNAFDHWLQLLRRTSAPFSAYMQHKDWILLCASPERYLQRKGEGLLSQPIKGTIKRSNNAKEDALLQQQLAHSPKDRSENVMIVDLVRNDFSRIAQPNSVEVSELFGAYPFKTVHHLISSITAKITKDTSLPAILKATFPMGSMTGAPKISAMQIADKYENFRRGWYSGSIGLRAPNGDFDMNVIIRSAIYQKSTQRISCGVGGAITMASIPENELDETLLKARAIRETFLTE